MPNYSYSVAWSQPDSAYIALSPEFPGLSAFGSKPEEAVRELQAAIDLALETYKEEGWPLPEPHLIGEYSGQFRLRLPKSLHHALALRAEAEGVSLNTLAVIYLSEALGVAHTRLQSAQEYRAITRDLRLCVGRLQAATVHFRQEAATTKTFTDYQDPLLKQLYAKDAVTEIVPLTQTIDERLRLHA